MKVPFVDMTRLHAPTRDALVDAFARVVDSGAFVQGHECESFEREFAAAYGVPHALGVNSGTAALHLALQACGVGPGDEVITVANTFIATAEAISLAGATAVFADIVEGGHTIDPVDVERRITPRTRAIIAVHLYGEVADMAALSAIARSRGVKLIEDACQAHGAAIDGRRAGTLADAGCLSFYPTKNVGTVGEGGMVLTHDDGIAARVASLRNHGQTDRHVHVEPGYNYRMSELQAAALRVLAPRLPEWNAARVAAAGWYAEGLAGLGLHAPAPLGERHVFHLYVIRHAERAALGRFLGERGVATAIHYPTPIHLQPAYASEGAGPGSLPRTEETVREILSLPMHPSITRDEVAYVCDAVRAFVTSR